MRKFLLSLATWCLAIAAHSQSWSLTGNAGTNPSIHFVGTRDNNPLRFRINNLHGGEVNHLTGNTSLGYGAGAAKTSFSNVAIGVMALNGNTGQANSAIGAYSLTFNTGAFNVSQGYAALYHNTSGVANSAIGYNALTNNTNGSDNVAVGREALSINSGTYSSCNSAVGSYALYRVQNAQFNTAIGFAAGDSWYLGYNNTILGANCDGAFDGQYNIVAVGQGVICPDNSTARIGNSATWSIGGYASWTNFSDGRYKKDVNENVKGLDFIMKLRPVTYHLDISGASRQSKENGGKEWDAKMKEAIAEKEKAVFSGFVAQEVEQAAKETGYDFSGVDKPRNEHGFYGLRYSEFVVPLVKGMQEQQELIVGLKNQNAILLEQNSDLQKRIANLERRLGVNNPFNAITVRPNPSSGKIVIDIVAENQSRALIQIFDSKGALIKQQQSTIAQGNSQVSLDIKNLPGGTYHVTAEWDNGQMKKTAQIIKQ
jgi:hypothetical protein